MELAAALDFARPRNQGVLTTIRSNGRPQLSNILYWLADEGLARISITEQRAKTKNLRRDPRTSLYVRGDDFWSYAVLEGTTELTPAAARPDDPTVEELILTYRALMGEHADWEEYRRAMVEDRRIVARFVPERAYGALPG